MLTLATIRKNTDAVRDAIAKKRVKLDLDALLALDTEISALKTEQQGLQTEKNALSRQFRDTPKEGHAALREASNAIGARIDAISPLLADAETRLKAMLLWVPQPPADDVPVGPDDSGNVVERLVGTPRTFDFALRDHVQILEGQGWAELERVTKVSGSRNFALKGDAVRLELALHQLAWDRLEADQFTLITVPDLVREEALLGTGHFPAGREDVYHVAEDDLFLAGTAEVVLTSLHAGEILDHSQLPILYAGTSPCFRREAGSFGRDVRGLLRVHQFNKTEQYVICEEDVGVSEAMHQRLLGHAEALLQALELPYQVLAVCTGDMGAGKYRMHDLETWVPSLSKYRETHSCSSLHTWQATRANLRYRDADGKVRYCHTLNNTAIATPRLLVPFLENHQNADGTIYVPPALRPYLGGRAVLGKPLA